MKPTDEKPVPLIFQILKDRPSVLSHQDGMRRVVVDAELSTDTVTLTDTVQGNPWPGRISDVVVPAVTRRPSWHGTLLNPIHQTTCFRLTQQGHELTLEHREVRVHSQVEVAPHE